MRALLPLLLFLSVSATAKPLLDSIADYCTECPARFETETASFILEHGEDALMSRGWLVRHAQQSIDIQYFIWSTDNIGILAAEALLTAAERGVKIRVLIDDLLIDAEEITLLSLAAHPNVEIRVYNPKHSVGTSLWQKLKYIATDFHGINQRMHDKTVIFDNTAGITGGRNMADEYFDYNHHYNFRDRDILLMGRAVDDMTVNFEKFWTSEWAVTVENLLEKNEQPSQEQIKKVQSELHAYADDETNFEPEVRAALQNYAQIFPELVDDLVWDRVHFISDAPGKNNQQQFLAGSSESTEFLLQKIKTAKQSILIQSPYLIIPEGLIELLQGLIEQGVEVKISTNSLASTDNLMAFSGYQNQRLAILEAGIQVYEYMPHPQIQQDLIKRYPRLADNQPVFAIHAKSMVIDDHSIFIGTFNLDPRSANLNTEVGAYIESKALADELTASIERDIHPSNSWQATVNENPDSHAGWIKRIKSWGWSLLPLEKLL